MRPTKQDEQVGRLFTWEATEDSGYGVYAYFGRLREQVSVEDYRV